MTYCNSDNLFHIMNTEIQAYNNNQLAVDKEVCDILYQLIDQELEHASCKIWHAHPVWFLDGNPIVGYSKQKTGIRLLFWSGADFDEAALNVRGKKFKDASIIFKSFGEISIVDINRWLKKSIEIQWDYLNVVKRKGKLERLK